MKSLSQKCCFSKKSHRILNSFTLQIQDKVIAAEYRKTCAENFDSLFNNSCVILLLYSLLRLGSLDWSNPNTASIFGTACHYPPFILWFFMRRCRLKLHAPRVMWLYALIWVAVTNLSMRDVVLPAWTTTEDKKADEDSIMVTLVIFHTLNYTSYLETVIFLPACILTGYYLQMVSQVEIVATIDAPKWGGG